MDDYDVGFLQTDWDGAGVDVCVFMTFDVNRCSPEALSRFIEAATACLAASAVKYADNVEPMLWKHVSSDVMVHYLFDSSFVDNLLIMQLESGDCKNCLCAEYLASGYVSVGGPIEAFYSGSRSRDAGIVRDVISVAEIAVSTFGDAYGAFGVGACAAQEVETLAKRHGPKNFTRTSLKSVGVAMGDWLAAIRAESALSEIA